MIEALPGLASHAMVGALTPAGGRTGILLAPREFKPRELLRELTAAIQNRGLWPGAGGAAREIALGGGLTLRDATGRAKVDPHALGFLLRYLSPGDTMVDVGANIGIYSVLAGAIVGSEGRVEAFEPSPSLRPCLEENLRRNGLANVHVHARLAGGRRMIDPFVDGRSLSGRRRIPARRDWVRRRDLLRIASVQIDEVLGSRPCALVHIDVAGYELRVLEGAEGLLRRPDAPPLLIAMDKALADYGQSPRRLVGWLSARRYDTYFYDGLYHLLVHASEPWRLNRVVLALPDRARNRVLHRLAQRSQPA
jgi:FkbM family methyltransferase